MSEHSFNLTVRYRDRQVTLRVPLSAKDTVADVVRKAFTFFRVEPPPKWVVRLGGRELDPSLGVVAAVPDAERANAVVEVIELAAEPPAAPPSADDAAASREKLRRRLLGLDEEIRLSDVFDEVDTVEMRDPDFDDVRAEDAETATPSEEESDSEAVALDESDSDLESSDFDLALDRSDSPTVDESGSQEMVLDDEGDETVARPPAKAVRRGGAVLEDEEEEEEAPRRRKARPSADGWSVTKPLLADRQATVRYYSRMNPQRCYPLLVVLSREQVQEIAQKNVAQTGRKVRVRTDVDVEVEPLLPGCTCYPPVRRVRVTGGTVQAAFHVVPHVLGLVDGARVVLRQGSDAVAEIPLQMRVSNKAAVAVIGAATFLLPFATSVLRHFRLDFDSQLDDGFPLYAWVVQAALTSLRPEFLAVALLALTVLAYLWLRPRKRDLFWDVATGRQQAGPAAFRLGDAVRGALRKGLRFGAIGGAVALALGALVVVAASQASPDRTPLVVPWMLVAMPLLALAGGAVMGAVVGAGDRDDGDS